MLCYPHFKVLSSIYLSIEPQLNVGCFNVDLPSLGSVAVGSHLTPELLSPTAAAIACTVAFTASTAICAVACVIAAW